MGNFQISSEKLVDGIIVIKLAGMLDVFNLDDLKRYIRSLSAGSKQYLVTIDLGAVDYIASSGWSVLITSRRALLRQGGDMSIFGMREGILRVYKAMHVETMLPSAGSMDDAERLLELHEIPEPVAGQFERGWELTL